MIVFLCFILIIIYLNRNIHFNYKKINSKYNLIKINFLCWKNNKLYKDNIVVLKEDIEILKLLEKNYINKKEIR